jgi:predicted flavoprotein YhiN
MTSAVIGGGAGGLVAVRAVADDRRPVINDPGATVGAEVQAW